MKQKDKIDILSEVRLVNVCLTESARTLFWIPNFMAELETSKDSAFCKLAGTNSQILDRRESNDFVP